MVISLDSVDKAFRQYTDTREYYKSNFEKTLAKKEYRKASELLWGVISQAIKALASLKQIRLGTHPQIRAFAHQIAKEFNDSKYYDLFLLVEKLHVNFYDEIISPVDFQSYIKATNLFLEKTDKFIERKREELEK